MEHPTPGLAHLAKRGEWKDWTTPEATRQGVATINFIVTYQYIITAFIAVAFLRNVHLYLARRHRRFSLSLEKQGTLSPEKLIEAETNQAMVTWGAVIDSWVFMPLSSRWWCTLENPMQVFIFLVAFAVNIGFMLGVSTDFRGKEDKTWNTLHVVALRSGFMAAAQFPALFALTGRNSLVQMLTGIEYQHLRFVHKLLACWMGFQGAVHTIHATVASSKWLGGASLKALYTSRLGVTGVILLLGFAFSAVFAIKWMRLRYYETFLVMHILGAVGLLVGLACHVPTLRFWVYLPVAFWMLERVLRIVQLCSVHLLCRLQFRKPLVQAQATLIEGAIVLRVPFKGQWKAGQHAYISFWDSKLIRTPHIYGQNHPFSCANVPGSSEVDSNGAHEMLFVMRTRDGMTKVVAELLEKSSTGSAPLLVAIEGPYGGAIDTEQFEEILFVCGGSGITHIMSMTADCIHRAQTNFTRVKRIKLVWTVQNIEQSIWSLTELLLSVKKAQDAGIELSIELYVTRGVLKTQLQRVESFESVDSLEKKESSHAEVQEVSEDRCEFEGANLGTLMADNPMSDALAVIPGRPPIAGLVPAFISGAHGRSLVVTCGPAPMTLTVRREVNKLVSTFPVELDAALFEC